ncbi:hypothetical protein JW823_03180 [bacterium]|nr:hypothetical protein [candidate division CSSED10-310 bacterium]
MRHLLSGKMMGIGVIALLLIWYLVTAQNRPINRVIREVQDGFHDEDASVCLGYLSSDYIDAYGYGPDDIRLILMDIFQSLDDINVIILEKTVRRQGRNADVSLDFRIVATHELGVRGYIIGDMKQPAHVVVHLSKSDRDWRITSLDRIENP